jgi:hypothetical protein
MKYNVLNLMDFFGFRVSMGMVAVYVDYLVP